MKLTIMSKYLKDHLDQLLHGQLHSWRRALPRVRRDFSRAAIHSPGFPRASSLRIHTWRILA